ncbi:MAG: hypothetical protein ACJ8DF_03600, partial [Microvirga sp.]
ECAASNVNSQYVFIHLAPVTGSLPVADLWHQPQKRIHFSVRCTVLAERIVEREPKVRVSEKPDRLFRALRWRRSLLNIRSDLHSCVQAMENVPSIFRFIDKIPRRHRNAVLNALHGTDLLPLKRL